MNENFIKVTWETDKNGNPPTGFAVMEKQVGRERAKADLLGVIRLVLEQDDEEIYSEGVTIALPGRVKPE